MKKYLLIALMVSACIFTSCTLPQMALESSFKQQAEELPIAGRSAFKPNGSFAIGNYTVANVDRGWANVGGFSIFNYNNIKANQQYQFKLQNGQGSEWYVFGASKLHDKSLKNMNGVTIQVSPNMEYFGSHFTSPESGQWHLLTVDPNQYLMRKKFQGELSNGSVMYKVSPVYKFEDTRLPMSDIVGYEFRDGETIVGAVQVLNNGKVWIKPELDQDTKMVLTSAMASLLLYEKLNEKVEGVEID